jgi:aquaporin Z
MRAREVLRRHWPEYLIEAWALGTFMVAAGVVGTLLAWPGSPLHALLPDPVARRVLAGIAMGLTAIALIYSPWGKRSGAHLNPAVTLTFLRLGKVRGWDAMFFIAAQFAGGILGVLLVAALAGAAFTSPPVNYVATLPAMDASGSTPPDAIWKAFTAEGVISCVLMLVVLSVSNSKCLARYTGVVAGSLVTLYISIEEPLSGMSMNPARTFASAAPAMHWQHLWIYFTAPVVGMLAGAQLFVASRGARSVACAKLLHPDDQRCIHCGYEPVHAPKSREMPSARSS